MKKIYAVINIIAVSVVPTFLVSCAALDDIARGIAKKGSSLTDDVVEQVPKGKSAVVPVVPPRGVNQNKLLAKCSRQAGKSAVIEAWNQANSSGIQVYENYLLDVARDAIQKCTVGNVGDEILDELANSVVTDFKQENPQAELN